MTKQKAKIIESWRADKLSPRDIKRFWIVSLNGQSQVYCTKKEARAAKAGLDAKAVKP
jgi:hypothetical protein